MSLGKKKARRYSFTTLSEAAKDVQGTEIDAEIRRPQLLKRKRPRSSEESQKSLENERCSPSKKTAVSSQAVLPAGGYTHCHLKYYGFVF